MSEFKSFAEAIRKHFAVMANDDLFVVDTDRDEIWNAYLASFPKGTNETFRKRKAFDCSCCRSFIRSMGNVVAIQNGAMVSIWDVAGLDEPYQSVANGMSRYIKSLPIISPYLTPFNIQGTSVSRELVDGSVRSWFHFSVDVPPRHVTVSYTEKIGDLRSTYDVLVRGLKELTPEAFSTVLDLINSKSIYRGDEFKSQVEAFQNLQARYLATSPSEQSMIAWTMIKSRVARFRNTAIGTLVQDLSEGYDLEDAVKSFESKVAPQNYKRPTALITKSMVNEAMKAVDELGLTQALHRRHARLSDVSVNSVLFVDNSVSGQMKGGFTDLLMEEVKPAPFNKDKATEIGIDDFVKNVLPKTTGLQLYLGNELLNNFVSLTAPVDPAPAKLFKWDNDFAWSYEGNVTDSIKDKVKRAGGMVENVKLRISLAWHNYDDLDLHVIEPKDNNRICYFSRRSHITKGELDVDMNAGAGTTREPVENIRYKSSIPVDGTYKVIVNQFSKRESIDVGFNVEIEHEGGVHLFKEETAVPSKKDKKVADIIVKGGNVVKIVPYVAGGSSAQERWGLKTQKLVKVNSLVLSPNYWDDNKVGNKHWFFILEGCKNPAPTRGIYNEFLNSKLEKHRKVFEILGDKTKCPVVKDQMSGIGVSSTRKDRVTVMAVGPTLNKAYTIVF